MEVVESVNKVLSPLVEFTDAVSGEQYVSVSCLDPVLHHFQRAGSSATGWWYPAHQGQQGDDLNEKYAEQSTQELLDMASLLHPRFKSTYIEAERLDYMKVKAAAEMESLADEQRARHCHQSELLKKFLLRKRRRIWAASSKEDHVNAKLSLGQRESPLKWSLTAIYRQLKFTVRPNTLRWDSQSKQLQIGSKFLLFFFFYFFIYRSVYLFDLIFFGAKRFEIVFKYFQPEVITFNILYMKCFTILGRKKKNT